MTVFRHLFIAVITLGSIWLTPAIGCGLHGSLDGGFEVSYPGALRIAMAVAEARRDGVLPGVNRSALHRNAQFDQMLADLEQVQLHLDATRRGRLDTESMVFSLVLVGPGLWSHYHMVPTAVEAQYHAAGPLEGHTVIMTHHAVLRALVLQTLTAEQAVESGLIEFSGNDVNLVQDVFEASFQSTL